MRNQSRPVLSVVIPAWNEERRLPAFLPSVHDYLTSSFPHAHEAIVVDDGSTDRTCDYVRVASRDWEFLRLVRFERNAGKGAAVRAGLACSRGAYVLYCDADGATPLEAEKRLRTSIDAGADIAVGSRFVNGPGVQRTRSLKRRLSSRIFSWIVRLWLPIEVRDTQCGFKMLRREALDRILPLAEESGYLFDLELLGLAQRLGIHVEEIGVPWREIAGSKLRLVADSLRMLRGLPRLSRRISAAGA